AGVRVDCARMRRCGMCDMRSGCPRPGVSGGGRNSGRSRPAGLAGDLLDSGIVGRFDPTGEVEVKGLGHSVVELVWRTLRGAHGPSDGSAGAITNVPSALSVIRHAGLYKQLPDEIEEAFTVLERHVMRE